MSQLELENSVALGQTLVGDESEIRAGEEDVTGFYTKDAQEMGAGPSGATKDEYPNQVQNDDVGTERNKITRGD